MASRLDRLAPAPERGDVLAAGAVVLAVFGALLDVRFTGAWAAGVRFVVIGAIAALVGTMAVLAPLETPVPRPYQAVLNVAAFVLAALALGNLADALGADSQFGASGTVVWVGALLCAGCAWLATRRHSPIMTLLGAVTAVVVANALVDWIFDVGAATFRWILLLCAVALALGAVALRDLHRRHAVSLVDAAGLSIVAIGLTLVATVLTGALGLSPAGGPAGWELVLLAFGFGLAAYGAVDRERVAGFIGVAVLGLFVVVAGPPGGGASLIGWPIVLAAVAVGLLAAGLRPPDDARAGAPPPPDDAPPPTAPTAIAEP